MICYKISLVFNKMEETFQSNTLDWSSLVSDILPTQRRFVKYEWGLASGLNPPQILQTYFGQEVCQKITI